MLKLFSVASSNIKYFICDIAWVKGVEVVICQWYP